jgi:hypothetical protein
MMGRFRSTRFARRFFRLSSCSRGEDKGEGFERTRLESILTLPLSFEQGEATPHARCRANLLRQHE